MKTRITAGLAVAALTASMLCFTGPARGYDETDLSKLMATNDCQKCDLFSAPMDGLTLTMAQLRDAKLNGAKLNGAKLNWANLREADLSGAYLDGATLNGANLTDANLSGANLSGAVLSKAVLSGANLSGATWTDGRTCGNSSIGTCE